MQNDETVLRSLNKQRSSQLFTYNFASCPFTASRDWETVRNVVPGNSSLKPDQLRLGSEGKCAEQSFLILYLFFIYSFICLFIYSKSYMYM